LLHHHILRFAHHIITGSAAEASRGDLEPVSKLHIQSVSQ
jgi:hypothetical protein